MKIVQEHNYVPDQVAHSLKNSKTNTIGIIVPDIRDYFYMFIKAADAIFSEAGYSILLADSNENSEKEEAYIKLMYEKRVDGLILATVSDQHEALEMYFRSSVPVIFIDNLPNVDPAYEDCVILDNSRASYQEIGGYNCMKELLENRKSEPFTAVYVSSYKMTCGALRAIKEENLKIPDDIALIGFDFTDNTGMISPTITTIIQPIENIGNIVAKRLLSRIRVGEEAEQGEQVKDIAQKIILSPEIFEGESSKLIIK